MGQASMFSSGVLTCKLTMLAKGCAEVQVANLCMLAELTSHASNMQQLQHAGMSLAVAFHPHLSLSSPRLTFKL